MHVNRWLNDVPLQLSEISLGNLFEYGLKGEVVITGIHLSGKIEVADIKTREVEEIENYNRLKPISLPQHNTSHLHYRMKGTSFICKQDGYYFMIFDGKEISLIIDVLNTRWIFTYQSDEVIYRTPIYYLHEFQNAFNVATKSKLSFI